MINIISMQKQNAELHKYLKFQLYIYKQLVYTGSIHMYIHKKWPKETIVRYFKYFFLFSLITESKTFYNPSDMTLS